MSFIRFICTTLILCCAAILFGSLVNAQISGKTKLKPKVTIMKVEDCSAKYKVTNPVVHFSDITVRKVDRTSSALFANVTIKEDIDLPVLVLAIADRCESLTNKATCTQLIKYEVNDGCNRISKKGRFWSSFVDSVQEFEKKCPIKAGNYTIERFIPDMDAIDKDVPLRPGFYSLDAIGKSSPKVPFGCIHFEGKLEMIKE